MYAQTVTDDGVILRGVHLTGPDHSLAVVLGHGFTLGVNSRDTCRLADAFARHAGVVALSFRGHGDSGGACSVGDLEVLDLAAAVRLARLVGYRRVATVGFSMGAAVAIRHAGLRSGTEPASAGTEPASAGTEPASAGTEPTTARTEPAGAGPTLAGREPDAAPDAVVAVSSPARWWSRETRPMRAVHWLIEQPHGRLVARLLGVRLGPEWAGVPESPVEVAGRIAPTPLLLVHGDADRYFSPWHARALQRATSGHAQLWIEPGMGHGESGTSAELAGRIARWARAAADMRAAA